MVDAGLTKQGQAGPSIGVIANRIFTGEESIGYDPVAVGQRPVQIDLSESLYGAICSRYSCTDRVMVAAIELNKQLLPTLDRYPQIVLLPTFDSGLSAPAELYATTAK